MQRGCPCLPTGCREGQVCLSQLPPPLHQGLSWCAKRSEAHSWILTVRPHDRQHQHQLELVQSAAQSPDPQPRPAVSTAYCELQGGPCVRDVGRPAPGLWLAVLVAQSRHQRSFQKTETRVLLPPALFWGGALDIKRFLSSPGGPDGQPRLKSWVQ